MGRRIIPGLKLQLFFLAAAFLCWLGAAALINAQPSDSIVQERRTAGSPPSQAQMEAGRDAWQRVPDIFAAMGVREGAVVADVGAGNGYFTTRLAKAVGPTGRVYAVDISSNAIAGLRNRLEREGLTNVELVLSTPSDPKLPAAALDAALIINAYHEMREHQAILAALKRSLKPNGRLVIVEPIDDGQRGAPRANQESHHQIAPLYLQQDALQAGFVIVRFEDRFTTRNGHVPEYLIALEPAPAPTEGRPIAPGHGGGISDAVRKPDEVVAAIAPQPGQVVVDLGAGSGVFTRRFAAAVGSRGKAIGLDIEPGSVEALKADAAKLGLANYEARLVQPDDPGIPARSADVIFLSNTYHHIENRVSYFSKLKAALKPGGRLIIVDFAPGGMGGTPCGVYSPYQVRTSPSST